MSALIGTSGTGAIHFQTLFLQPQCRGNRRGAGLIGEASVLTAMLGFDRSIAAWLICLLGACVCAARFADRRH
jgi:hypothetical protein